MSILHGEGHPNLSAWRNRNTLLGNSRGGLNGETCTNCSVMFFPPRRGSYYCGISTDTPFTSSKNNDGIPLSIVYQAPVLIEE